jgi:hypothetical protein
MEMIAAQFGLAMMPRWSCSASELISGTTSGTPESILNAEELSITTVPLRTAIGAKRFDVALPAEKSPMSTPLKLFSVSSRTGSIRPENGSIVPAERADANSCSSESGKRRRSRHPISSTPTAPVAPTIATTGDTARE